MFIFGNKLFYAYLLSYFAHCFSQIIGRFGDKLLDACYIADLERIKLFLSSDKVLSSDLPIDVNSVDTLNRNALMLCGLDPQFGRDEIDLKCSEIAKLLNSSGLNLTHIDNSGLNSVHYSVVKGLPNLVTFLCELGSNCDQEDYDGRTPLMKSVAHAFPNIFEILLNHEVNATKTDKDGLTILHYAARLSESKSEYLNFLKLILSKKIVDVNKKDNMGRTALMYATLGNSIQIANELLSSGADPRLVDNFGISAAGMCRKREELYHNLIEASAKVTLNEHKIWEKRTSEIKKEKKKYKNDGKDL